MSKFVGMAPPRSLGLFENRIEGQPSTAIKSLNALSNGVELRLNVWP